MSIKLSVLLKYSTVRCAMNFQQFSPTLIFGQKNRGCFREHSALRDRTPLEFAGISHITKNNKACQCHTQCQPEFFQCPN